MKSKAGQLFVAAVLLFGAVLRLLYLYSFSSLPLFENPCGPDVLEYWRESTAMRYSFTLPSSELIHAPLYPCFLACIRIFTESIFCVRLIQSILVLASGLLFYAVLCDLFHKGETTLRRFIPEGFLLIYAIYPPFLMWQCDFYCENLLIIFLAFTLFLIHCSLRKTGRRAWILLAASGLASGMTVLTHPMSAFFCAGIALYLIFRKDSRIRMSRRLLAALLFTAAALATVIPVSVSRSLRTGKFVVVQLNSGFNVYLGNHAGATGSCCIPPGDQWDTAHAEAAMDPQGADRYFLRKTGHFIVEKPGEWGLLLLKKAVLPFTFSELTTWSDVTVLKKIVWHRFGFLFFPLLAVPALAGIFASLTSEDFRKKNALFLILFFSSYAAQLLLLTSCRYRIPMVIAMMAFAPWFLLSIPAWLREKQFIRIVCPLVGAVILVFLPLRVLSAEEEQKSAFLLLAEAYDKAGDKEKTAEILRMLYANGDRSLTLLNRLASWELDAGHWEAALLYLNEAKDSCASPALLGTTYLNLGRAMEEQGKIAEAAALYQAAAERLSERGAALAIFNLGTIIQKQGNVALAEKYYLQALEMDPLNPMPMRNLAIIALDRKEFYVARQYIYEALRLAPNDVQRKLDYAYTLYLNNDMEQAGAILESVLQADPNNARAKELRDLFTR